MSRQATAVLLLALVGCNAATPTAPPTRTPTPVVDIGPSGTVTRSAGTFACFGTPLKDSPWTFNHANYAWCAVPEAGSIEELREVSPYPEALDHCSWVDVGTPVKSVSIWPHTGDDPYSYPIKSDACNGGSTAIYSNVYGFILKSHTSIR